MVFVNWNDLRKTFSIYKIVWKPIKSLVIVIIIIIIIIIIDNISKHVFCLVLGCQNREPIISHYYVLCNGLCGYLLCCSTSSPFFMENLLQKTTAHCQLKIFRDPVHSFLHTMKALLNDFCCCRNSTDWSILTGACCPCLAEGQKK